MADEPFAHRMRAWQKLLPIVFDEGDDVGAFPQARLAIYMYLSIYMYIDIYIYISAFPQARLGFRRLVRLAFCAYKLYALT